MTTSTSQNPELPVNQDEALLSAQADPEPEMPTPVPPRHRVMSLRKLYFYATATAYSLSAVTLWRLPYVYSRYGAAFLIPLTVCALLITCPLLCLELFVGQLVWSQSYLAWPKLHPALCGLGLSAFIFMLYITIYLATPAAWAFAAAWHGFAHLLGVDSMLAQPSDMSNSSEALPPWLVRADTDNLVLWPENSINFFHRNVLTSIPKIEAMSRLENYFVTEVLVAMAVFWAIVCILLLLRRQIHNITLFLTSLLFGFLVASMAVSLIMSPSNQNSFVKGIKLALRWDAKCFLNPRMWLDAAGQSLLAVGGISGFIWVNAAHLRLRNDFKKDAIVLTVHHLAMSLLGLIFVYIGLGSYVTDSGEADLFRRLGPTLPFVAYFGVFSNWTNYSLVCYLLPIIFYVLFGLVQACCHVYNLATAVNVLCHSRLPCLLRNNVFAAAAICLFLLVFSHPFTTSTGLYLLQGLDDYVLPFVLLMIAIVEFFLFAWIYSWSRVKTATLRALHSEPCYCWAILWRFIAPVLVCLIVGAGLVNRIINLPPYVAYDPDALVKVEFYGIHEEKYPVQMGWMDVVLIALALLPLIVLPLLRKCGVVIFPYAPLRPYFDADSVVSSVRDSGDLWDNYNFPFIDDPIEKILAWESRERERIMYETLHNPGGSKASSPATSNRGMKPLLGNRNNGNGSPGKRSQKTAKV